MNPLASHFYVAHPCATAPAANWRATFLHGLHLVVRRLAGGTGWPATWTLETYRHSRC